MAPSPPKKKQASEPEDQQAFYARPTAAESAMQLVLSHQRGVRPNALQQLARIAESPEARRPAKLVKPLIRRLSKSDTETSNASTCPYSETTEAIHL